MSGEPSLAEGVSVEVIHCAGRGQVDSTVLVLAAGATAADALLASGLLQRHPGLDPAGSGGGLGIHGQRVDPARVLLTGDRLEVYRALIVEPKDARRQRQHRHRRKNAAAAMRVPRPLG